MVRKCIVAMLAVILLAPTTRVARNPIRITQAYTNTNPQNLIGLPMGSHNTIADRKGNLHWSQWSLKHRRHALKGTRIPAAGELPVTLEGEFQPSAPRSELCVQHV